MTKPMKIADDLSLPLDVVTQTMAILAKRRAGKSYTMRRLIEQLFKAGQQVVVVDPKGDQWGLRSAANGKDPGLPIVILGGERGDVPLEPGAGEIIAKLVVEERVSALLDLSLFRKHEVATFMTAFLENLYRLKAREIYRTPMMLVIDEADAIAPQKAPKGHERMLGAADDIVRRGGQRGIGCVLVTQRSAVLNKNVLTQAQILVVLRTIAPQDLKAMKAWIEVHGDEEQGRTLMESLPSLPTGDAWVWSPGWPTIDGIFKRVHVLPIETFDSGATPKPGTKAVEPKNIADIDLDALKGHMAATIEKAKADDPKKLKARVAELERDNDKLVRDRDAKKGKPAAEPALNRAVAKRVDRLQSALENAMKFITNITAQDFIGKAGKVDQKRLEEAITAAVGHAAKQMDDRLEGQRRAFEKWRADGERILKGIEQLLADGEVAVNVTVRRNEPFTVAPARTPGVPQSHPKRDTVRRDGNGLHDVGLPMGERAILIACAQHQEGATREQLTQLTGYKRSTRDAYIARLRDKGYVDLNGDSLVATPSGISVLGGDYEPLPTGDALRDYWLQRLPEGERTLLTELSSRPLEWFERSELDAATGYKRSTRDAYLARLANRKLIVTERSRVRASDVLFS